jgi:hypothetical protein
MSALRRRRATARPRTSAVQTKPSPLAGLAAASSSVAQQSNEIRLQGWRVILRVFLPFTAAFFMAYLFRSINALIASDLSGELALDAADMGLLTSVYFLTFAALQVPVGIWLDRYGPRRVEATLMLFAVAGALLFAMSKGFALLTLSRALIGLGVAAAFTGGLKAIAQWFPKDRVSTMNGYLLMLGALGALSATSPARVLLDWSGGWRGLFVVLAAATAVCTLTIWIAVPEAASAKPPVKEQPLPSLKTVYSDSRFWRGAPLSATCAGTTWALQSLWAAPWLTAAGGRCHQPSPHHGHRTLRRRGPVGDDSRSPSPARDRSPGSSGHRGNNGHSSTVCVDPAMARAVLAVLVDRGRRRVSAGPELRHSRRLLPQGDHRARKRRAKPVPFRGRIRRSIPHRRHTGALAEPRRTLPGDRLSGGVRP